MQNSSSRQLNMELAPVLPGTSESLTEPVYLRHETKMEPLVCSWYAWSYLVAPAQHAMNLAYRHLPLLQSFLDNPAIHISASQDPALFGGPFVNLTRADQPAVRVLIEATRTTCERALAFARDVRVLDHSLQESAHGYCLDELYRTLPDSLRGLVDLVYDTSNRPGFRLYEDLLQDEALAAGTQQIRLSLVGERERAFFMSTPRLESADELTLKLDFTDPRIDAIASMRTSPKPLGELAQLLDMQKAQLHTLGRYFTSRPIPRRESHYTGSGVRIRYFGHACVLIQTSRTSILMDPLVAFEEHEDGRFTFADLPDYIDHVVLTHSHQDHCVPEVLLQLRHRIGRVSVPRSNGGGLADPSMKLILRNLGFTSVSVLDSFDCIELDEGRIVSLPFPGEHADLDVHSRQALFVSLQGRHIAFLVDSDCRDSALYARIMRKIGSEVDALFLGMECRGAPLSWLYGPLLTTGMSRRDDESRRLSGSNCERAWAAVRLIAPKRVFVYAMGQEPWLRYLMGLEYSADSVQLLESGKLLEQCAAAGIPGERLHISREIVL